MATSIQTGQLHLYPKTRLLSVPLPAGDRGIAVTIGFMRLAAQWGEADPQIRQLALDIVRSVPKNDTSGEIAAVFDWVHGNIDFRGELDEMVQTPEVTLRFGAGDCDDHSVLNAALLGTIGYQWDFKTVALGGMDYSHVYLVVLDHATGEWVTHPHPMVAVDTTVDEAPGWEPPGVTRAALWPGSSEPIRNPEAAQVFFESGPGSLGSNFMRRGLRGAYLGDDGMDQVDPSTGVQIADVLTAATPITITAIQAARGGYSTPGYGYPGYSQYGINVGLATPPNNVPVTQRPWFWPTVFGTGLFALWSFSPRRGGR